MIAEDASLSVGHETLPLSLDRCAERRPDARALGQGADVLSYRDLQSLVAELNSRLGGAGVRAGDRVGLLDDNTIEWVVGFLAVLSRGAIVVPLNNRLSPGELARQLALTAPVAVLASQRYAAKLKELRLPAPGALFGLERGMRDSIWEHSRAGSAGQPPHPDKAAVISFTSGATGAPRGATISHRALIASAMSYVARFETTAEDATVALVPLFHNTGFVDQLTQMIIVGGAIDLLPRFGVRDAIDALRRSRASYLIAVPSIFRLLMLSEDADVAFKHCSIAAFGGSSMPVAWIDELEARWPHLRLFNVYGLTEFTSVSHLLGPEELRTHRGSVGRPVAGVRHRVVSDDGKVADEGELGEVQLAGPMRMRGYWRDDAATEKAFAGEWLRTGDLGSIDSAGYLTVRGRSAEVINRGGEKIHAAQVESALSEVPEVAETAVVGAPHPIFQESVVACVVARAGAEFREHEVRSYLAKRLPDYAIPERFLIIDELPRNAAGKVDRQAVREATSGPRRVAAG